MRLMFAALSILFVSHLTQASDFSQMAEPAYCDLNTFKSLEVKSAVSGLPRLHAYQVGRVLITGLAVGDANTNTLIKFNTHYSNVSASDKYCTWYLNQGNQAAEKAFAWRPLSKPTSTKVINEYMTKIGPEFDKNAVNMVSCAENKRLITLGCQGMRHRGPTVFGMLLAYSGCSAVSATKIVNSVWGNNGIKTEVRQAIMQKAYELGVAHADKSAALRTQLLAN